MANICLVTKLKMSIDNDSLPKLGELIITMIENTTPDTERWLEFGAGDESIEITTDGTGHFGLSSSTIDSDALTAYTIPANTSSLRLYFNKGSYGVHISNKYALTRISNGSAAMARPTPMVLDIEALKYCENLQYIRLGIGASYGDISNLANAEDLTYISLVNTNCTGSIKLLSKLINLTTLRLYSSNVGGSVEEFVAGQIAAGRETCNVGALDCRGLLYNNDITFGKYKRDASNTMYYISWTDAEHITLYIMSTAVGNYDYSNVARIYAKGATAEQIAQWENDGKTVVVITDDDGE